MKKVSMGGALAASALMVSTLVACKTTGSEPQDSAPAEGQPVAMNSSQGEQPAMASAAKTDVPDVAAYVAAGGSISYIASGGRTPFESVSCSVSWHVDGAKARAVVSVVPRGERFVQVDHNHALETTALQETLGAALTFDAMDLPKKLEKSTATDLRNFEITFKLNGDEHVVEGYGLQGSAEAVQIVDAIDELCMTGQAVDEAMGVE